MTGKAAPMPHLVASFNRKGKNGVGRGRKTSWGSIKKKGGLQNREVNGRTDPEL